MKSANISQAADITGVSRRTIQRWISRGEIEKDEKGMISLQDVKWKSQSWNPKGGRKTANQNVDLHVDFCSPTGAKRLSDFLFFVGLKYKALDRFDKFTDILAGALEKARDR